MKHPHSYNGCPAHYKDGARIGKCSEGHVVSHVYHRIDDLNLQFAERVKEIELRYQSKFKVFLDKHLAIEAELQERILTISDEIRADYEPKILAFKAEIYRLE